MERSTDDEQRAAAPPAWVAAADRVLARAMRHTRLLGAATPLDLEAERGRLVAALEAGRAERPRWTYPRLPDGSDVRRALDEAIASLEAIGTPLADAYAARAREIADESALAEAIGGSCVGARARARFDARDPDRAAASLAASWLAEAPAPPPDDAIATDGDDPRSLLSRMRAEVGRLKLPFSVAAQRGLVPLAATGERTIWIAAGRVAAREDVERTVMHEIEAHARPRARAATRSIALFRIGTARGSDEQEGLALVLEERHGFLGAARRRELALRHWVVEAMDAGATFPEVVTLLAREHALPPRRAIAFAERAFRGGDGLRPGLGRERVYLPAFLRVRAHLTARPADERILASGQIAVGAIAVVAPFAGGRGARR